MPDEIQKADGGSSALANANKGPLPRGPERAMLFLVSLDEEDATRLLAHMNEGDVAALREATDTMKEVPPATLIAVYKEFLMAFRGGVPTSLQGSGAYLRRLAGQALGESKASRIWKEFAGNDYGGTALSKFETTTLATLLDSEHPQTIAVVLSQIDPEKAAEVLSRINADARPDVIERLGRLESVPEPVLEEIEREFAVHLAKLGAERKRKIDGKDAAAKLLKRLGEDDLRALLDSLSETSPEIATVLEEALFTFEDLLKIDGRGMQQLLKEVPTDQLVLALKTASEELREKIFGNLSSRAADMLREDLSLLGPVRVSDVEEAQRTIIQSALELEKDGRIVIAREGSDMV